jgi:hypothetical protein
MADLRKLWDLYCEDCEASDDDLGNLYEYGLCFDYVPAGTFSDQERGWFRYQISTGGPGDEFRFYADMDGSCHCVEYWFLDWYDGAKVTLTGDDKAFILELWEWFRDLGCVETAYDKAGE